MLRQQKREISMDLETKKFLSEEKSSEKQRFTRFTGKFPIFAALLYPPVLRLSSTRYLGTNILPSFASKVNE